jgi:exopolyphosphatase/guanosine-5'-triphosphate,3'-diphosphate pyrophosphatase
MIVSVVDIGTNTVLLLVASVAPDGRIDPLLYEQRIPRLGKGVDQQRTLQPDSMARVIHVLREYQKLAGQYHPDVTVACATSAVRDASNSSEFVAIIREKTGLTLDILSGSEEALWTFRGAISGIPALSRATVIDIGGGSTEIIVGSRSDIQERISLNIGSVRVTERFFTHDPPLPSELDNARRAIFDVLMPAAAFSFQGSQLVGVAGTATSLAMLVQGRQDFDIRAVTNYHMTRHAVDHLYRALRQIPSSMIRELSPVMEGRADVIVAGALILLEAMQQFGFEELVVSERGVRFGLALREAEKIRR